jgi:hypothetical protein
MSSSVEGDWGEGAAPRAERRGPPSWVWWGCGGGCLLATLAVVVVLVLLGGVVRDALDPEKAWAGVAELLPHEKRPAGWHVLGTTRVGHGFYVLRPPDEEALVIVQRATDRAELAELLDPHSPANSGHGFLRGILDAELGTLALQGREAPCLRYRGGFGPNNESRAGGVGLRVDVTGAGVPTLLHLMFPAGEERVSEERVNALLAPFDVWRGRGREPRARQRTFSSNARPARCRRAPPGARRARRCRRARGRSPTASGSRDSR